LYDVRVQAREVPPIPSRVTAGEEVLAVLIAFDDSGDFNSGVGAEDGDRLLMLIIGNTGVSGCSGAM
jgi:hypothetical protein